MDSSPANNALAARAEKIAVGSRQTAQGQTYAVDYIRQQVIAAVGWDRAINEGYRIHTTIDVNLQRAAEDSLKAHLDQAEQHPGLQSSDLRRLRSIFSEGQIER